MDASSDRSLHAETGIQKCHSRGQCKMEKHTGPHIMTSPEAFEFARSVTGYGYEKHEPEEKPTVAAQEGSARTSSKSGGYRKWEKLVKEIEDEEQREKLAQQTPEQKLMEAIKVQQGEMEAGGLDLGVKKNPVEALDALLSGQIPIPSAANDNEDDNDEDGAVDANDTSQYFTREAAALAGGCAHDRSKERNLYNRPTEEKLRLAKRFRTQGNEYFAKKEFRMAASQYQRALVYYDYTFPETPEQDKVFDQDKVACHLNMAAARVNLKEYRECISQCYQALKIDPKNAKAYFRQGQAHLALDEFDEAEADFNEALKFGGDEPKVLQLIAQVKRLRRQYAAARPQMCKNMFNRAESRQAARKLEALAELQEETVPHPPPEDELQLEGEGSVVRDLHDTTKFAHAAKSTSTLEGQLTIVRSDESEPALRSNASKESMLKALAASRKPLLSSEPPSTDSTKAATGPDQSRPLDQLPEALPSDGIGMKFQMPGNRSSPARILHLETMNSHTLQACSAPRQRSMVRPSCDQSWPGGTTDDQPGLSSALDVGEPSPAYLRIASPQQAQTADPRCRSPRLCREDLLTSSASSSSPPPADSNDPSSSESKQVAQSSPGALVLPAAVAMADPARSPANRPSPPLLDLQAVGTDSSLRRQSYQHVEVTLDGAEDEVSKGDTVGKPETLRRLKSETGLQGYPNSKYGPRIFSLETDSSPEPSPVKRDMRKWPPTGDSVTAVTTPDQPVVIGNKYRSTTAGDHDNYIPASRLGRKKSEDEQSMTMRWWHSVDEKNKELRSDEKQRGSAGGNASGYLRDGISVVQKVMTTATIVSDDNADETIVAHKRIMADYDSAKALLQKCRRSQPETASNTAIGSEEQVRSGSNEPEIAHPIMSDSPRMVMSSLEAASVSDASNLASSQSFTQPRRSTLATVEDAYHRRYREIELSADGFVIGAFGASCGIVAAKMLQCGLERWIAGRSDAGASGDFKSLLTIVGAVMVVIICFAMLWKSFWESRAAKELIIARQSLQRLIAHKE